MLGVPSPPHALLPVLPPCKMPHGGVCGRLGKPGRSWLTPSLHMPLSWPAAPQSHARLRTPRKALRWKTPLAGSQPTFPPSAAPCIPAAPNTQKAATILHLQKDKGCAVPLGFCIPLCSKVDQPGMQDAQRAFHALLNVRSHLGCKSHTPIITHLCPPNVLPNACASSTAGPGREIYGRPSPSAAPYTQIHSTIQHRI